MNQEIEQNIANDMEVAGRLMYFLRGNSDAVSFCMDLFFIAHLWDDQIDRDKERTNEDISAGWNIALFELPKNPFYQQHITELMPIMKNYILEWQDANVLERGSNDDKHQAFVLRNNLWGIVNFCALLIGGDAWVKEVSVEIRRMRSDTLDEFMKEFENA